MRCWFVCVLAVMLAWPQGAAAQAVEKAPGSAGLILHAKNPLPPQLMLRASYYLYLDADADADAEADATSDQTEPNAEEPAQSTQPPPSRLQRWHPDAFEDPTRPASQPALELEADSAGLKVTPTAPPTPEGRRGTGERSRGAKAGIAVGVILGVGLVGVGIGAAVAMSNWKFEL